MRVGKLKTMEWITRDILKRNPDKLFVFGDNMKGIGLGGQAKEMRGEPNALGIPTKWLPSNHPNAYFDDTQYKVVTGVLKHRFADIRKKLESGCDVIFPKDGIGTGLADLKNKAPNIFEYIEENISNLKNSYGTRNMRSMKDEVPRKVLRKVSSKT